MTPPKLLIAEDEYDLRAMVAKYMKMFGMEAELFPSCQELWDRLETLIDKPDLILSDINMKGMDGIELYERIIKAGIKIPVVLMTGEPGINQERLDKCKAPFVLSKPFNGQQFKKILHDALQSRIAPPAPPNPEVLEATIAEGTALAEAEESSDASGPTDQEIEKLIDDIDADQMKRG